LPTCTTSLIAGAFSNVTLVFWLANIALPFVFITMPSVQLNDAVCHFSQFCNDLFLNEMKK
jgi:hypothetical protein